MKIKTSIPAFLIVLPNLLAWLYDKMFRYAGNWLEDYQNYFKLGFLAISILSCGWLVIISKKEKSWVWLVFSSLLLVFLLVYMYMGIALINMNIGL